MRAPRSPHRRRATVLALVAALVLLQSCRVVAWARHITRAPTDDDGAAYVSLAPRGPGFRTASLVGAALGRQYVRAFVHDALTATFARLVDEDPARVHVVAETGHDGGGPFPPHHSHQDGRAVDVLVPLVDDDGAPAALDASLWNLWGYCWRLDDDGRVRGLAWEAKRPTLPVLGETAPCPTLSLDPGLTLDFAALARFLVVLDEEARARGSKVRRAIVAPEHRTALLAALPDGWRTRVTDRAWIRHDEHVHVELAARR